MDFETTHLWRTTLGPVAGDLDGGQARERLRNAFRGLRSRACFLAAEIARNLPSLTVHDITHLDALWETADLVAGPALQLTPPEVFILGGAILLHDLGMSVAAYPGGIEQLKATRDWRDAVASLLRQRLNRFPCTQELEHPPPDVMKEAIREALRLRHAEQAITLATMPWIGADKTSYYLIEDVELRKNYGEMIGRIAHSHHLSVSKIADEFSRPVGALPWCDSSWTVDLLKVACLLRLADASHVDARRAPGFLQALRQPEGISAAHWTFQEKLLKPRLERERLVFTAGSKFALEDAAAWWLCLDTLRMIDQELRQVDTLLVDLGHPRMAARGVAEVSDPTRLVRLIPTDGWSPVDARVRVSDISSLVERLGGKQLYGADNRVPLRELIQNAMDAVRARRLQDGHPLSWGAVTVRFGRDEEGHWVEIEDTGLGMSEQVLTKALLDFGTSYWSSSLVKEEWPGLLAKGFLPTGRYGIGFFSVFMWGRHVRVTSLRADESRRDTRVLEFTEGVGSRPILRTAREMERLLDGGTRIRVWLDTDPHEEGGIFHIDEMSKGMAQSFERELRTLCPCPDTNLYVEKRSESRQLVSPSMDWVDMDGMDFLMYVSDGADNKPEELELLSRNLRVLRGSSGQILGRACVAVACEVQGSCFGMPLGLVSDGVFRGRTMGNDIAGVFVGAPTSATRHDVLPIVDPESLANWASEQARLWLKESVQEKTLSEVAQVVRTCGGDVDRLPVAQGLDGWLSLDDIAQRSWPSSIVLLDPIELQLLSVNADKQSSQLHRTPQGKFEWDVPILLVSHQLRGELTESYRTPNAGSVWPTPLRSEARLLPKSSLAGGVVEALAQAWRTTVEEILVCSRLKIPGEQFGTVFRDEEGVAFTFNYLTVIHKPQSRAE